MLGSKEQHDVAALDDVEREGVVLDDFGVHPGGAVPGLPPQRGTGRVHPGALGPGHHREPDEVGTQRLAEAEVDGITGCHGREAHHRSRPAEQLLCLVGEPVRAPGQAAGRRPRPK